MTDSINNILSSLKKIEFKLDNLQGVGQNSIAYLWEQTENLLLLRGELINLVGMIIDINPNIQNERNEDCQVSFSEVYRILIGDENSLLQDTEAKQIKLMEMGIVQWFHELDHLVLSLIFLIRNFLVKSIAPWSLKQRDFISLYSSLDNYAKIFSGISNKNENLARMMTRNERKRIFELVPERMRGIFDNDFNYSPDIEKILESAHMHQVEQALSQNIEVPLEVLKAYPKLMILSRHVKIAEKYISLIDQTIATTIITNFENIERRSIINLKVDFERFISSFKSLFSGLKRDLVIEHDKSVILFKHKQEHQKELIEIIYVIPLTNSLVPTPWSSFFEFERGTNYPVVRVEQIAIVIYDHDKNFEYEKDYQRYVILQKGKIIQK